MNTQFQRAMPLPTITNCVLTLAGRNVFGLGGEYTNGQTLSQPAWPVGMKDLVNAKQRIGGMFVNTEDIFFYSGTASELSAFLDGYAKIQNIERHRLILHRGAGHWSAGAGGLATGNFRVAPVPPVRSLGWEWRHVILAMFWKSIFGPKAASRRVRSSSPKTPRS